MLVVTHHLKFREEEEKRKENLVGMRKSFLVENLEEDDIAGSHVRIRSDSTVTLHGSIVQKVKTLTCTVAPAITQKITLRSTE